MAMSSSKEPSLFTKVWPLYLLDASSAAMVGQNVSGKAGLASAKHALASLVCWPYMTDALFLKGGGISSRCFLKMNQKSKREEREKKPP